ncbi:MAG TPA: alpha/beta fold hydrolase [Acidimicrobiales bacterium]|nr:alpha/beta fold hydrolase [Acidimicrobiales bacterium]
MSRHIRVVALVGAVLTTALLAPAVRAAPAVGTTFPAGFPVILDHSLKVPVIGFGSDQGPVRRTPVILLHGNNDTPYPTNCNGAYGAPQAFGQYLVDHGYSLKEVWGLGYQGDQCDLLTDETRRAAVAHTTVANVPDLRAFVSAVLRYTGAPQVDIVGHSLGATLAREWMRQDNAYPKVRRLVAIDGPHHGIINCSPDPRNYYVTLGFVPDSPVCLEYGSDRTPFLRRLNRDGETPGPTRYLAIVNADNSFVYIPSQDGVLPAVPAQDREGYPHDFGRSARLRGAETVELTGQGINDKALLASHTGIVASPDTWKATLEFLTRK